GGSRVDPRPLGGAKRAAPAAVLPDHRARAPDPQRPARGMGALHRRAHAGRRPQAGVAMDWTQLVRRHADAAGVDLPPATVDELTQHLEDIYAASRADGNSDADARRAAL